MIFVPLPLFATLLLALALVQFSTDRDMRLWPNRLFAALIALYALQSLILSLRWGYGIEALRPLQTGLAPVLPALAWLAFRTLSGQLTKHTLWVPAVVIAAWLAQAAGLADIAIPLVYLGFGALLLRDVRRGADALPLAQLNGARRITWAMGLTGAALIGSACMDIFVLADFILAEGRHVGTAISLVNVGFVLTIGLAGRVGRPGTEVNPEPAAPSSRPPDTDGKAIIDRLVALFETEGLHRDEDLNLRRLSRRLGLPDRQVSNAINRCRDTSVSRFVNDHRIKDARKLLLETDQSVLQISLAVGFSTKSNFNREFARVTGTSPTAWRQSRHAGG